MSYIESHYYSYLLHCWPFGGCWFVHVCLVSCSVSLRLKSVKNIQKITQSMKVVSTAKFARAEKELKEAKTFGAGAQGVCASTFVFLLSLWVCIHWCKRTVTVVLCRPFTIASCHMTKSIATVAFCHVGEPVGDLGRHSQLSEIVRYGHLCGSWLSQQWCRV